VKLVLNRCWLTEKTTIGKLIVDDVYECLTLEDVYRGDDPAAKVKGQTAIPCGVYEVIISWSPRFQVDMPLLLNVPGFSGVRIHTGNTDKDTAGCILVGHTRGPDQILGSRVAYEQLFGKLRAARERGEHVELTIRLTPHLQE
jgi:hypothetical protein